MKLKLNSDDLKSLEGSVDALENPILKSAAVDVLSNNAIAADGFAKVEVEYVKAVWAQAAETS